MQMPERPSDGEAPNEGGPSYEWLDEWLCEYVDGTMDPSLEAVFEQYVEADPELKAHVERLRQTRELLRGCDAPDEADSVSQAELSCAVEEDLFQSSTVLPEEIGAPSTVAVGLVSSIAVALVVGFLAGSMFVEPTSRSPAPTAGVVETQSSSPSSRSEAPPRRPTRPASTPPQAASFSGHEPLFLRPTTAPAATEDTARAAPTFITADE